MIDMAMGYQKFFNSIQVDIKLSEVLKSTTAAIEEEIFVDKDAWTATFLCYNRST